MAANLIHAISVFTVSDRDDEGYRRLHTPGVQAREEEKNGIEQALLFPVVQPDSSNSSAASANIAKSDIEENGMGVKSGDWNPTFSLPYVIKNSIIPLHSVPFYLLVSLLFLASSLLSNHLHSMSSLFFFISSAYHQSLQFSLSSMFPSSTLFSFPLLPFLLPTF